MVLDTNLDLIPQVTLLTNKTMRTLDTILAKKIFYSRLLLRSYRTSYGLVVPHRGCS